MLNNDNDLLTPNRIYTDIQDTDTVDSDNIGSVITESQLRDFGTNKSEVQANQTIDNQPKNKVLDEILVANLATPVDGVYKLSDNANEIANLAEMQKRIDKIGVSSNDVAKFNDNISPDIAETLDKLRSEDIITIPSLESYTPIRSNINLNEFKFILTKAYGMSCDKFSSLVTSYNNLYTANENWVSAIKPNINAALLKKPLVLKGIENIVAISKDPKKYASYKQKILVSTVYTLEKYLTLLLKEEDYTKPEFKYIFRLKALYDELIEQKDPVTIAGHNAFLNSPFCECPYTLRNLSIVLHDCGCSKESDVVTIENVLGVLLELLNISSYQHLNDLSVDTVNPMSIDIVKNAVEENLLNRINTAKNLNDVNAPYDATAYTKDFIAYLNDAIISPKLIDTVSALYETIDGYNQFMAAMPKASVEIKARLAQFTDALTSDDYDKIITFADDFVNAENLHKEVMIMLSDYQVVYSKLIILGESLVHLLAMYGDDGK